MHRSTRSLPGRRPRAGARAAGTLATAALLLPLLGAAPPQDAAAPSTRLQDAFASAAAEYQVPQSVLLGVSYLQSRWDTHGGAPSVTGGYGPMHLTDAATAIRNTVVHSHAEGDARGDDSRAPLKVSDAVPTDAQLPSRLKTLTRAAELTGIPAAQLRSDSAANVRGGAALLAAAQKKLGKPLSATPADWYGAVAKFSGADDTATAATYANDVFAVIRDGERRTTDAGQDVTLAATSDARPRAAQLEKMGLRKADTSGTECPRTVSCEWIPAPYEEFGDGDYGNHDLADRPKDQSIDSIVIHDTEGSWDVSLKLVQDKTYLGWHYTLRSTDGHIAQHIKTKDVGWHAGNWYTNAKSIGIEHEGFLTDPDTWYTEEMYRSSARLVTYLAKKYGIPLDRQHILGHDNVPGPTTATIPQMHTDPGPYWDWAHYFALMGKPFHGTPGSGGGIVTVAPRFAANKPQFTGCTKAGETCTAHGSSAVRVYTAPSEDAPLVKDIGLRPGGEASTIDVNDMASRVSTGQQYAVAERKGDWTAIWYLGQKAWFKNPKKQPTAVNAKGLVVTPKAGASDIPVYGRAYPEASAYPAGITPQAISPLPYKLSAGQRYVVGERTTGEYFYSPTFDTAEHKVVKGKDVYYEIQFAHRVAYVRAADVRVLPSTGK
ncbi:N-acetylmuramoyl-L-alanine amidase [Streptomyces sp. SID14478]|uniref:N-acetylmuramoyl-L-alanine amidase n=1 Tax=Streptomyces sp. SID14478 TaxID=2706073 RepID=UPI0013DADC76|nr:peptidoglycan recognition family protein [Streptomyces sp. SID14478]NEB74899.1 N-acetylmuramoyl-L-alanine amidase [Streptomyces sp. SID14478]